MHFTARFYERAYVIVIGTIARQLGRRRKIDFSRHGLLLLRRKDEESEATCPSCDRPVVHLIKGERICVTLSLLRRAV